jgi:hypothetical protein
MNLRALPHVPVSWGELIDKITILEIKKTELKQPQALANAARELALLDAVAAEAFAADPALDTFKQRLLVINRVLWVIEDDIREKEAAGQFDAGFIELARSVYQRNDERAAVKREINDRLGSELVEEKSYAGNSQAKT